MADHDLNQRALVDALDEPALVIEGLTISVANPAARDLLGQAIEGRDIRLAIRQPELLEHVLSGHPGDLDVAGIGDFGRPWRVAVRALDLGTVFVRLIDRSDNLSAEKMRVDFVANASHELRTPLSAVLGYAETLADDPHLPADTIASFGRTVRDEAGRMLRIVEDLMSLSRIEADRFVAPEEMVDLRTVAKDAIANASTMRGSKKCEIVVEAPKKLPKVRGDRGQLVQLFDNLVSNALRYGCDKPGACVEVKLRAAGSRVEVSVIDHGPGIPRDHLPRVTERFYRVDEARSRESGGTGLGLAIVKHIVERHRGALAIDSKVGIGTIVTVTLPTAVNS
ncbi:MAG: ATP-binding protein [Pseudomonadota bacterium]|nr:ATP-binding protein [Pseudomonadota bacterium]